MPVVAVAVAVVLLVGAWAARAAEPVDVPVGARDVLNAASTWRWHVSWRPPTCPGPDGRRVPLARAGRSQPYDPEDVQGPPPPEGWTGADFDDSTWPRSRLPWFRVLAFGWFSTERVSMRGKFTVSDPAKAELYISTQHVGGVVIYLNGKEVCRADMPAGALAADTLANPYEQSVYLDASGKPRPRYKVKWEISREAIELRQRRLAPTKLPADALRKGVNVLAVEVRRAPYAAAAMKWLAGPGDPYGPQWPHADLSAIRLSCVGDGAVPNVARPAGLQVWPQDRNDRVTVLDYADPNEPPLPVRIVAARNGSFCGQLVVGSDKAIDGLKVAVGDLTGPAGSAAIPAANTTLLYGRMDFPNRDVATWCDSLQEQPVTAAPLNKDGNGAVQPVLLRVRIPADAAAGEYRGEVSVSAAGRTVEVPVQLNVADWRVPDPKDYRTYMGIYQSPTSVAMQYGVPMWSERHWQLVEKSIALLSRVGNRIVNIPVVDQTQFGNDAGFVTWIRKADGSYEHDISVLERYVKLALKYWGGLDYVTLQIWHAAGGGGLGGWNTRPADTPCTVTVRDEKTGKTASMQVPVFGTDASRDFWRPVLAEIYECLKKLGVEKGMCLGIMSDSTAPDGVFELFRDVFPGGQGARWHRACHRGTDSAVPYEVSKIVSNKVILHEHCYGMSMVPPDAPELPPIHTYRGRPGTAYFRQSNQYNASTFLTDRTMSLRGLFCQKQGIGRICLDFWNVLPAEGGGKTYIFNRWPISTCAQRRPSLLRLTWPGADGAETTMRYEALVEGVQESEAMILVSEGAAGADRVGADLAERCRKLVREQLWFCHTRNQISEHFTVVHVNHYGWQDLNARTFALAGEVARKLGR